MDLHGVLGRGGEIQLRQAPVAGGQHQIRSLPACRTTIDKHRVQVAFFIDLDHWHLSVGDESGRAGRDADVNDHQEPSAQCSPKVWCT